MNCESRKNVGLYVDGELEPAAQQAFAIHLQNCADCAAAVLEQQELKKAVRVAGKRFSAPPELYASVRRQIAPQPTFNRRWSWALAALCVVLFAALGLSLFMHSRDENATVAQLVDQHITMLASANPVDVISEDRHTVKPWFQGRLPFTFNLPEFAPGSDFKLLGGKMVYAGHAPGAELVYQVRQHKISVFIFQSRDVHGQPSRRGSMFTINNWQQRGLEYYAITDAAPEDADRLRALLEQANRS